MAVGKLQDDTVGFVWRMNIESVGEMIVNCSILILSVFGPRVFSPLLRFLLHLLESLGCRHIDCILLLVINVVGLQLDGINSGIGS